MTLGPPGSPGSSPSQGPNLIPPAKSPLLYEVTCPAPQGAGQVHLWGFTLLGPSPVSLP